MNAPTLHLGGTSFDELYRQFTEAREAIRRAHLKVQETCPHPRDYIGRDTGYKNAMQNHSARLGLLNAIYDELDKMLDDICRQNDKRHELHRKEAIRGNV